MPVSGLVITFETEVSQHQATVEQLRARSAIEIGEASGPKLAIVVDSQSSAEDQEIWHWVHGLPGVAGVEVAFVGFE